MPHYLLQTLIFQVLFLVLYDIFHKKDTFFIWNRIYLTFTPILSLIFPFIKIQALSTPTSQVYVSKLERVINTSSESLVVLGTTGPEQSPTNWWLVLYCLGVIVSLFLLVMKFYKLNILTSFSFKSVLKNQKIVTLPNSSQAFSFWNTIYLGDQLNAEEKKQIVTHEIVHVEQKHSLDQLFFEILKVVLWWNPMIYIYQSRITILHEYLADAAVVSTIEKRNYIEQLLNSAFQTQEITFVNQFFNKSLIKKRIFMLQKSKSKTIAKFKYLLLAPVIIGILSYTSSIEASSTITRSSIENSTNNIDESTSNFFASGEPICPNENSEYNGKLNNYLKLYNGKSSEAIVDIVSTETSKKVRTVYITQNTTQFVRNIPEGTYKLNVVYGKDYAEKQIDGECKAYFTNQIAIETNPNILDFKIVKTKKRINVPSYSLSIDLKNKNQKKTINEEATLSKNVKPKISKKVIERGAEPKCPNQNAQYDTKIDNYLKITAGKDADVILTLTSLENQKVVRTIHVKTNQVYIARNIPEGTYEYSVIYGDDYAEKTIDNICMAYFKNVKKSEKGVPKLDYNTVRTKKGLNVPSYNLKLEYTPETKK